MADIPCDWERFVASGQELSFKDAWLWSRSLLDNTGALRDPIAPADAAAFLTCFEVSTLKGRNKEPKVLP